MPSKQRPKTLYGAEVWRDLDWLPDTRKTVLNVGDRLQIAGDKCHDRHDLATFGRRQAHATFLDSHATDDIDAAIYAIDPSSLFHDDMLDIADYTTGFIEEFQQLVTQQLKQMLGR